VAQVLMLPAELEDVTDPPRDDDELLTADELNTISLFASLKKGGPDFRRFPNTTILRHCPRGRVICEQGESGSTAYYILTTEDVVKLRELQKTHLEETIQGKAEGRPEFEMHPYFVRYSNRELQNRLKEITEEIARLKQRLESLPPVAKDDIPQREVAAAHLLVNMDGEKKKKGLLHRMLSKVTGDGRRKRRANPANILIDGPAVINSQTLRGPLHESELLGEMSCMNRAPRSATVVAEEDCYMLEMLRNVLDMLQKDPNYKKRTDAMYRKRVMETHVRRLSVFENLNDEQFEKLKEAIELVEYESGETIFEEGEPSDCFYVIRSGLVKVLKNAWYEFRKSEFTPDYWKNLVQEFHDAEDEDSDMRTAVKEMLADEAQTIIEEAKDGKKPILADQQEALIKAINEFIREAKLHEQLGKTRKEVLEVISGPQLEVTIAEFAKETKKWSVLEYRTFHRALLERLFPTGLPRQLESAGPRRTLAYLGRGEIIGEMGVFTNPPTPRSATCIAYDHPDSGFQQRIPDGRMGAVPSRVELVKINRAEFEQMRANSPEIDSKIRDLITIRQLHQQETQDLRVGEAGGIAPQSREFEQLGLIQGQKLMLIDLDRCTRCNACVEACVASHDDGRTRLYLDGPRYDKYLVPLTCRKCLDPVCMIGCPVGSINRGENGEIIIRDWCIGCRMCAEQCPYGSIQMNELKTPIDLSKEQQAIIGPDAALKAVSEQAVVCDLCSSLPSQDPSCVYACPHDAAFRVNAQEYFFQAK